MTGLVTEEEMIRSIRGHLPQLLRSDPSLGDYILSVTREHFPTKVETEDRFTRMLNELARDREAQSRKWDEQNRKWEEQNRKLDGQNRKWDEQNRKWDEQNRKWEEQKEENRRNWEESNRRFDAMNKRIDRSLGALGSRWGTQSERAFRDALAAILVESFEVEVINVNEFDDEGEVFGRPDQVELDVIIKNGLLILCELKSSMSKSDMHTFERKVRFYERRHKRQATRMIVVSPMIDDRARQVGEHLGIELYPDSLDVPV
ncbi:PD-(D/E)XK nuclease family protein [Candidatus Thiosymbion oneisti]|uniref:PD-(D/E)XK nuclease family protein n=1 Tax=Candidatus Thiosymbion oneisti TaxID=589554 RepID=UPI000AD09088|nr:DUF3782 domain-containing protein [Candidatus Thiosymbion oneisti]